MKVVYTSAAAHLGGAERALLEVLAVVRCAEPSWPLEVLAPDGPLLARARDLGAATSVLAFPRALASFGDFPPPAPGKPASPQHDAPPEKAGSPEEPASPETHAWDPASAGFLRASRLVAASAASLPALFRLRRALRALRPDVIHANGLKMALLCARARPRGVPLVWHLHDYVSSRPITAPLLRRSASRCTAAVAVSTSVADDVRRVCGNGLRVVAIHNTIDLETFRPDGPAEDLDARSGLPPAPPGTVRVGLVATMAHWKGHAVFLEALASLGTLIPVRGYVIGGPIYDPRNSQLTLADLRARADRLGLAGKVGFTGFLDRPADAMRALDIVVHASVRPEPFGLAVAEAMSCGRAVIASAAGGVTEIITPGVDASVHAPGDAAALAGRIATLAADPALRARMGRAARMSAERLFDRARLARQIPDVYRAVVH